MSKPMEATSNNQAIAAPRTTDCSSVAEHCKDCKFYRPQTKRRGTKYKDCTPTEYVYEPTGQGECMLHPPSVQYGQAAVDRNKHWAGETVSVVQPGFKQSRPIVMDDDFCGSFESA